MDAFDALLAAPPADAPPADLAAALGEAVARANGLYELAGTVRAYINAFVSTDSRDSVARRRESEFDQLNVRMKTLSNRFQAWVGRLGPILESLLPLDARTRAHAFALREMAEQAQYMMSEAEESLAAELLVSGAGAWGKLQGTLTSQLSVPFELDDAVQNLPMPALINLRSHADEDVRRRAYEAENAAWESAKEPLAAAMNGVKGAVVTLNQRRGREDALHSALDAARIDRATLQAMLGAMEDSFPQWRRYFRAKAARLGKEQLAWWDIAAPLPGDNTHFTWDAARAFVLDNFATFSPDLRDFAAQAFDASWIDAEQRTGKRGGAFCMGLPAVKESRILSNFDGSLDQVSTLAHELGHGYHNHCIYRAGKTRLQAQTPMTLAETASIMCETIVMQAVLAKAADPEAELAILETMIQGEAQVIVDIYSRYLFEQELFARRAQSELSAEDLCEIMERAQAATYGDGLDARFRQKWMWTWKPHYYSPGLSFYNFPYAFGLLFGTGLYAVYQQRGDAFVDDYVALLASTGEANAADLAARFGMDLRARPFWAESLAVIGKRIDRYCELAAG
jgi:pepF/M3 family oligoendopeptidase